MNTSMRRMAAAAGLITALAGAAYAQPAAEPPRGSLGFSVQVETGGGMPWNPELRSATVSAVVPGSAAERGGLRSGDRIMAVDGQQLSGAKARQMQGLLRKNPGDELHLKVLRGDGVEHELRLTVAPLPPATPAQPS